MSLQLKDESPQMRFWFLGFVIQHLSIEIDLKKTTATVDMPTLQNIIELKSLQGRVAYIRWFISNLFRCCQPFARLVKKGVPLCVTKLIRMPLIASNIIC